MVTVGFLLSQFPWKVEDNHPSLVARQQTFQFPFVWTHADNVSRKVGLSNNIIELLNANVPKYIKERGVYIKILWYNTKITLFLHDKNHFTCLAIQIDFRLTNFTIFSFEFFETFASVWIRPGSISKVSDRFSTIFAMLHFTTRHLHEKRAFNGNSSR